MKLFEAIVEANHRALAGDTQAGLNRAQFAASLPVAALSCIDPRLNPLLPGVLGLTDEDFIWLRNAGNIITGPLSSTMRSLALACVLKGGKEIAIIGHTDCRVPQTTATRLIDAFRALGVERVQLPDNLAEFFGLFASEAQNVVKAVGIARCSPLIGSKTPVHGLVLNLATGRLDWVVNGYDALGTVASVFAAALQQAAATPSLMARWEDFNLGNLEFPEGKIGEVAAGVLKAVAPAPAPAQPPATPGPGPTTPPPQAQPPARLPTPRPLPPRPHFVTKGPKKKSFW
jgi:carbonic anhydrase